MNSVISSKRLIGITPASIEKYLLLTGWTRDLDFANPKIMAFLNRTDADLRIAAPATDTVSDYYERVNDLVSFLKGYTGCNDDEIISSLKSAYIDRMQFRIIADFTKGGVIPLDYAAHCIEGLRELVLYSACAEEKARPVCMRTLNSAKGRLEKFQFEQTEIGSFIFNVGVRVADEDNEQQYLEEVNPLPDIPVEHRIVKRIEKAIMQVDSVADRKVKLTDLTEDAYIDGITANMCDALSMLMPENEKIELETTIHYAEALTREILPSFVKKLDWIHFDVINEISQIYRNRSLIEDATLVGIVFSLSKPAKSILDSEDEAENTVKFVTTIDNHQKPITLHLSPKDHALACDAYRDGKEVEVSGTIDKSGNSWFFSEVNSFKVIG